MNKNAAFPQGNCKGHSIAWGPAHLYICIKWGRLLGNSGSDCGCSWQLSPLAIPRQGNEELPEGIMPLLKGAPQT